MSYLGNTPSYTHFESSGEQFSGTGAQTVFTLARRVTNAFDLHATVSNVLQDPFVAYSVTANTISGTSDLTFTSAPPSAANNIIVVYQTGQVIAWETVKSGDILPGAVGTTAIADGAITTAKIADGTVIAADIADGTISTVKLADSAVTTAKLADSNVTTAKIADSGVTNAKIDSMANTKITGVITTAQLAATTGTGAVALATSPTLVTPLLGTPTSGVLTNCTGLPVAGGGTGVGTLTANTVLIGAGTNNVTFLAPGTSGNVIVSNGTTWSSSALSPIPTSNVITSTSVFTVPATITKIRVRVYGAGGGGGAKGATAPGNGNCCGCGWAGSGPGSIGQDGVPGGYSESTLTVSPGATYNVTIGAAGTAGSSSDGGAGGTSSFSSLLSATGGAGGSRGGTGQNDYVVGHNCIAGGEGTIPTGYLRSGTGIGGAINVFGAGSTAGERGTSGNGTAGGAGRVVVEY